MKACNWLQTLQSLILRTRQQLKYSYNKPFTVICFIEAHRTYETVSLIIFYDIAFQLHAIKCMYYERQISLNAVIINYSMAH